MCAKQVALSCIAALIAIGSLFDALPSLAADDKGKTPQRFALLVGVDDYIHVQDLKYCVADQTALAKQLMASGYPEDQLFLLDDRAAQQKLRPFKSNIETHLKLVLDLTEKGDTIVVGFSGHGVHIGGKSYLCPSDARLEDPQGTMVSLDKVYDELGACKASLKLLVVDACRNDPNVEGQRAIDGARSTQRFAESLEKPPEGISLLASCSPGQFAREDSELGHGVFFHFVLQGLQGKAADEEGTVSLMRLADYTSRETKKYVARKFVASQTPYFRGEISGPVDLCRIERVVVPPAPPAGPALLTSPFDGQTAVAKQEEWAKHLKRAVVETNSLGMKLKLIPPGEYLMGSAATEQGYHFTEALHRVRITKPYYMGVCTVTLGEFLKFRNDPAANYKCEVETNGIGGLGYLGRSGGNDPFRLSPAYVPWSWGYSGQTNDHPVVNVGWYDATAFCNWLSKKEGKTYRLPTEAEWEYACRAGTVTRYYYGNNDEQMLYYGNAGDQSLRDEIPSSNYGIRGNDGYAFTAPVGSYRPNAFGLYDMHGNVTQWCFDWYHDNYYSQSPMDDPTGPATGSIHVIRGGCWLNAAQYCRSANRNYTEKTKWRCLHGFRVICLP